MRHLSSKTREKNISVPCLELMTSEECVSWVVFFIDHDDSVNMSNQIVGVENKVYL